MSRVSTDDFVQKLKSDDLDVVDVRNKDEFRIEFVPNSKNVTLGTIEQGDFKDIPRDRPVYLLCQSGRRSLVACQILKSNGYDNVVSVDGGILKCRNKPGVVNRVSRSLPLMGQVQVLAGFLVMLGVLLSKIIHPNFIWVSGFVGAGLIFAGLTGLCPMANVLGIMPWNKGMTCKVSE